MCIIKGTVYDIVKNVIVSFTIIIQTYSPFSIIHYLGIMKTMATRNVTLNVKQEDVSNSRSWMDCGSWMSLTAWFYQG